MVDEEILAAELSQLARVDRVVADTSAIIAAAVYLKTFASLVEILAPPQVLAELGADSSALPFLRELEATNTSAAALPTDTAVVQAARVRGLPVFAEDRRVLQAAEKAGLACYPFGILCALPVLRGLWSVSQVRANYDQFCLIRPYRKDLDAYCRDLFLHLETLGH